MCFLAEAPTEKRMFLFSLLLFLVGSALFPTLKLFYFAPYMATVCYRYGYIPSLWIACSVGLLVDLFTAHPLFGVHAFVYTVVTAFLYKQQHLFFADSKGSFFLLTFLFSTLTTALLWAFFFFLEGRASLSLKILWSDFIVMPLVDSFYGLLLFSFPQLLKNKKGRTRSA